MKQVETKNRDKSLICRGNHSILRQADTARIQQLSLPQ